MTRFAKIYQGRKKKKGHIEKVVNVEGYGYIKRRLGILSNELSGPTYRPVQNQEDDKK